MQVGLDGNTRFNEILATHPDAVLGVLGNAFNQGVSQSLRAWQQHHIFALHLWQLCATTSLIFCACALLHDALALLLLAASHLFCHLAASHLYCHYAASHVCTAIMQPPMCVASIQPPIVVLQGLLHGP